MHTIAQLVGSNVVRLPSPDTYLRDAFISLSQQTTSHQVGLVVARMHQAYPDSRISSLNDHMLLVQGIPVWANSDHDADAITWEQVFSRATADDPAAEVASIDVCASPPTVISFGARRHAPSHPSL